MVGAFIALHTSAQSSHRATVVGVSGQHRADLASVGHRNTGCVTEAPSAAIVTDHTSMAAAQSNTTAAANTACSFFSIALVSQSAWTMV
jgi:hypothetical protein